MANVITDIEGFLGKEWHQFVAWLEQQEEKLKPIITIAENVLNAIKDFEASAIGQSLEAIIEMVIPASTGLINAFKLQLPVWLVQLKWIAGEANKSLQDQWGNAQAYLATIIDPQVYAVQLAALKSLFSTFFANNAGVALNIQQSIVLSQPTHSMDSILGQAA